MSSPTCKGEDILNLIPQRPPILMLDGYLFEDELHCQSELTVAEDNIFLGDDGRIAEEGILEHVAQTAAAHIGYLQRQEGEAVGLGYIGDIKRCTFSGLTPEAGDTLYTKLTVVSQVGGITMVSAETSADGRTILTCRMKVATEYGGNVL